jgi:RHS repeat-associated protein
MHTDWLGSKRVMTGVTGANSQTCTGLPFGDGVTCTGTDWNFNRFTDHMHDSETNLEHTWFRQYSGTQGRFITPDLYQGSIDLGNPQSLNRYAYVGNDPLNSTDPLGLEDCSWGCMFWWFWGGESGGGHLRLCSGWSGGPAGDGGHFTDCEGIFFSDGPHGEPNQRGGGGGGDGGTAKPASLCPTVPPQPPTADITKNIAEAERSKWMIFAIFRLRWFATKRSQEGLGIIKCKVAHSKMPMELMLGADMFPHPIKTLAISTLD